MSTTAPYETDYEIGQDNLQRWGMDVHNPVFWVSTLLITAFVVGTLASPAQASAMFSAAKAFAIGNFDWLFVVTGNVMVLFCLAIAASPMGRIRLGGPSATPEFSTPSWFAMLFAAGMGIGLMFWSVAEPVGYFTDWAGSPLGVQARTPEAASLAMGATLFHWGLHPWAIYALVGLTLAFFTFNKGLPLTLRSGFYPLVQDRTWGWFGHLIDITAVTATIFGLATSLGFGAKQAASGLGFLFGIDPGLSTQIGVIAGVTAVATLSVIRGLDGGVKLLSNLNMALAAGLLLFVFAVGPTLSIVNTIGQTAWAYGSNILPLSNFVGRTDQAFYHDWTVFYWAWWISWSPFVGMFIARISRGRTVRQFIVAVLLVPAAVTLIWMSVFGGTALHQVQAGVEPLASGIGEVSLSLFQMLQNLPMAQVTSLLAIVLVLVFFVTSSDSGSLVIDSITAGGKLEAPVPQRVFWAVTEGVIASALLVGGGDDALGALQTAAIVVGLPFSVVLLVMCVSLFLGLRHEQAALRRDEAQTAS
ncbi:MAG: BCCT family transporter [Myxococcales bacterium]|nr:BCCT family transporter [Myxococcales bacterium]